MLQEIFYRVITMGMKASYVILAVFAVRFLLRRMPKRYSYALWGIVGFRLICPVSFSSAWSIFNLRLFSVIKRVGKGNDAVRIADGNRLSVPDGQFAEQIGTNAQTGAAYLTENARLAEKAGSAAYGSKSSFFELLTGMGVGADTALRLEQVLPWLWLIGVLALAAYAWISWRRCRKRISHAVLLKENIYECDTVNTPFVAGIFVPKIYIPFRLGARVQACILAHERCHIRRRDYLVKPFAFLLVSFYWFHPLVWAAYYGMCRDMEMSCDERAVAGLGMERKRDYTTSLLGFSMHRGMGILPLAFGEPDTSRRIKNVLRFREPKKATALLTGFFLTAFLAACAADGTKSSEPNQTGHIAATEQTAEDMAGAENTGSTSGTDSSEGTEKATGTTEDETMVEVDRAVSAGLERFATAFCERDTETICAMLTDEGVDALEESGLLAMDGEDILFGFSSPWPWDAAQDYRILAADGGTARILYYAWTSDPHVTVWESIVHYQIKDGAFLVTPEPVAVLDSMCSSEEFYRAYPDGVISGTRMDYSTNGAGEALQKNAMLASSDAYKGLLRPGTAAVKLLNLLDNENKVRVTERPGESADEVWVNIEFLEFGDSVTVLMVRPWKNIWIPQDDAAVLGESGIIALENGE